MHLTDPQAIRALAHPLRLDLLELLSANGPSTAAQCGRILGVPQANCSFHLRQLAKYGYVKEAEKGADRRERQWEAADSPIRVNSGDNPLIRRELETIVLDRETAAIRAYADRATQEPEPWRSGLGLTTALLALTPDEAADLKAQWQALLQPFRDRKPEDRPGTRHVRYLLAATPLEGAEK